MPATASPAGRAVGYALNAFPYHTLPELWACLETDVLRLKALASPAEPLPIELRFSAPIVDALRGDRAAVSRLRDFLAAHDLQLVTVNGFVLARFHDTPVKEQVYLPAWHESADRLRFTTDCLDILAQLAPGASVSVPFGALKPAALAAIAPNILRAAEHARVTGGVVALEPEPGLCVETTAEAIEFFHRHVPDRLRPHLGVNFDLAHQLVEFEDLGESVRQLQRAGVPIVKVHVSNAAEVTDWRPVGEDSIYLHQTCGADAIGRRVFFALDTPATVPAGLTKLRVHYHLPVFPTDTPSTLTEVERFLRVVTPTLPATVPHIIETYTWPQQLRDRSCLVENIARELAWVRAKISLSGNLAGL